MEEANTNDIISRSHLIYLLTYRRASLCRGRVVTGLHAHTDGKVEEGGLAIEMGLVP